MVNGGASGFPLSRLRGHSLPLIRMYVQAEVQRRKYNERRGVLGLAYATKWLRDKPPSRLLPRAN